MPIQRRSIWTLFFLKSLLARLYTHLLLLLRRNRKLMIKTEKRYSSSRQRMYACTNNIKELGFRVQKGRYGRDEYCTIDTYVHIARVFH